MKKKFAMQIIAGLVLSLSIQQAGAQDIQDGVDAYKRTYYGPSAFSRLAGDDGVMTEADWINNRSAIETKYGADFRWEKAMAFDADGNGALSVSEAKAYRDAEAKRLRSEWRAKGGKLTAEDKKWLNNHPEFAQELYSDRKWLNNHPDVAKTAYYNKELLNKHPQLRKDLKNHESHLRNHPKAPAKAYRVAKKHPDKARKTYGAAKRHPGKSGKAARNPGVAGKRAKKHKQ